MKLSLYYPVKPHKINRPWGFLSLAEYQRFGFSRHNGIDIALVNGQPIFVPLEADVLKIGNEPNGGGISVSILSSQQYTFEDGKESYVFLDFLHCQEIKVSVGDHVLPGHHVGSRSQRGFRVARHQLVERPDQ